MEYVPDRTEYIRMMHGLLKQGGLFSLVKHNRNGAQHKVCMSKPVKGELL
jgi:hypothetical protein